MITGTNPINRKFKKVKDSLEDLCNCARAIQCFSDHCDTTDCFECQVNEINILLDQLEATLDKDTK